MKNERSASESTNYYRSWGSFVFYRTNISAMVAGTPIQSKRQDGANYRWLTGTGLGYGTRVGTARARFAICARDAAELERARGELSQASAEVLTKLCDVTDKAQVEEMISIIRDRLGSIDVLINSESAELG